MFKTFFWGLQMFAEVTAPDAAPAAPEAPAAAAAQSQQGQSPDAQQEPTPAQTPAAVQEQRKSFRELLQDEEYRREYEEGIGRAVKRRMRSQQKLMAPMVEMLAEQYGIDASDPDNIDMKALVKAVTEDNSRLEQEAMENGYSVEDWRTVKESRRIVAEQKAADEAARKDRFFREMEADGERVKAQFPDFNYQEAMLDPAFGRLAVSMKANGVANPVEAAYRAIHFDAIVSAKVTEAEEKARQAISQSIQSGMTRPPENGTGRAAATMKIDPRNLSEEQRKEIRERIRRGEHVTFG